jgi:phage regulator Rha-like protein
MKELGQKCIDSREVAGMVGKEHSRILKDIRRYESQNTEGKIDFSEFWMSSESAE